MLALILPPNIALAHTIEKCEQELSNFFSGKLEDTFQSKIRDEMKAIFTQILSMNEALRVKLISTNRPDIEELEAQIRSITDNPEFDTLEDYLALLEPKIQFGINGRELDEFTKIFNCMGELLDYRNELLGEIRNKIQDQKYIEKAIDTLKPLENGKTHKSSSKTYSELLVIKKKSEEVTESLKCSKYRSYFSLKEVRELGKSLEHITNIIEMKERSSSKAKIEKAYEDFIKDNPNIPELINGRNGPKKERENLWEGFTGAELVDIIKAGPESAKALGEAAKNFAEARKIALENKEKSKEIKERERLDKIYSKDYRRKIARRIDDLCLSFTKESEKNGAIANFNKAEIFIKRISRASPFWSKNNRNWIKVVDYFIEVHKQSPVLALKNFIITKSKDHDFKNIELLLPALFLDVSQPKLELPIKPQADLSTTGEHEAAKKYTQSLILFAGHTPYCETSLVLSEMPRGAPMRMGLSS